ncbi:RE2, partial [Symbiodinium sp. KB8]
MDPPVDDGAGAPPDPWAEAARATRAHVRGDDPADDQEDSGNRSRRAWRRAPHSEANALGDPADGGNVDDDEPEYDATLHGWQDYDPTKHAWNPRWSRWTGWESSWDPMWNYDWSGKLWSGTPSTTSGDGQQWDGKWHDADKSDPWDSERRTSSGLSSGWNQEWNKDAKLNAISGAEWRRRSWASEAADRGSDFSGDRRGGLSERMTVPSFSANNNGDELGQSARSYLRQIEAWVRITRAPSSQQALLLYQNLQGRAWVEAEELDVKELCQDGGVERFKAWISERYLEIEVGKIAEALNGFFKRMKRGSTQSVREFNASFDRAYARLVEIDCKLPETAKAWAYLSSLSLTHSEELAILGDSDGDGDLRDDPQTELEVDLYEAFITAKAQYKEAVKHRNLEPDETANITNEVFETSGVVSEHLLAITDSVDNFKFGASRVYASNYAVVVSFQANRLGLAPSARWTVEELKSAIMEAKKDLNEDTTVPKGMSGMKLAELKAEADRIGVMYASGVTRGTLMRHIRDYHETPDNTVMNIGRYRGSAYFQVPLSYAQWADQEERANGVNMSPDLKRFVLWFRRKKAKEATGNGPTRAEMMQEPEKYAKVPYPGGSETSQSWENVTVMNEVDKQQRPFIPESSGAKSMASSSTSGKRTAERPNTKERMSVEPDPNVLDEIRALEQRLALLKDKVGPQDDYNPDPYDTAGYQESKPEDPTENVDYKNNVENKHVENHFDYQRDDYNLSDATGEDELSFDDYDAEVLLTECTEDAIHNAIKSNDYTPQRLLHLLQEVFGKDGEHFPRRGARKRTRAFGAGDLGENRIVLGYYTYGSMRGICNNSSKYASLSIYIKNYFLSRSADAKWSSLSISLNSASRVHSDHNNLKGTGNYITTVGDYTNGGGIWTENKDGNYDQRFLDGKGNKVKGVIQDTYGKVHEINLPPTTGNANYRGTTTSSTTRPKRSTRKSLWRTATRVSTFMAWSLSAMLSFSNPTTVEANDYKIGKDTALLEIGGMTQTLDATTVFERITGEPLLWPDIPTNHAGSYVLKYILELNPRMLWLHPPTGYTGEDERKFFEVLDICGRWQVEQQRALVVSVDGADPDLLQRLQKQLSAYGDVSYSILGEENIFRVHRTEPKQAYVAEGGIGEIGDSPEDLREGAAGITFDKGVAADTAAALRRLHQNLGHPAREDLVRHLRLAGADNEVIKAAKGMACSTCARTKRPKSARPSSEPKLLEFGDVVGVDMMYAYDMNGKKIKLFSIVDHASSYQVVIKVPNQTGKTLEQVFLKQWIQIFGAPKAISLDLERGIQDAFGRIADWFHIELHTSAGQAHWQSGYTERHGKWWKEIFDRVVQDQSVGGDEIEEAVAATSSAKNNLRRKCGWAPSQIVFGKLPRDDEDLKGEVEDGGGGSILRSPDEAQHRREIIRNAARIAFYKTRTEEKIRRGLSQRARIKPRDLENGATVFFWRKPASKKYGIWKGPGVVIGRQHENYWISHGGRCYLCAPEHLRCALPEELGGLFALRATKDDLLRLVDQSYDDVGVFAEDEGEDMEEYAPSFVDEGEAPMELDNIDLENGDGEDTRPTPLRRAAEGELPRESVRRRYSTKRPPGGSSDPPRREDTHHEAMILKRATTRRGKEKQLEKEIPWSMIPESKRPLFIEAERKQWQEHLHLQALRPLSVEESRGLKHSDRVLTSRFAYRDKNLAKRRLNPEVEWKPKSRLVVSGQTDPDIVSGALRTDSPTVSRTAVMALLQIAASRQDSGWGVSAGDVTAAFLNGEKLDRELYLRQPKHGLPGLHPEQLIKVEKGIFGLIDSPRKWWKKFKKDVQEIVFKLDDGKRAKFYASPLDPCVFQLIEIDNEDNKTEQAPSCYAAVHVDDILLVCDKKVRDLIQHQLSECFPVEEWENDTFDFIGSHIGTKSDGIFLSQANYTASRLFEIDIDPKATNDEPGTAEQTADNRSL